MSELRDRIAAAIDFHAPVAAKETGQVVWCRCTGPSDGQALGWAEWTDHVADAVIAELQIDVEDGECNYCHAMLPGCRYSTWKDE